ncbi:MAG: hypothetical protein HYS09_02090 [Chloroflexi bacterium]|nr:hypothetical protein [Chloroflexota bacterium]
MERALTKEKLDWIAEYPLPVTIVEGIDAYEEMRYFHVINTRQKGVPTDVVDRHLLTMREAEGLALLEREGERNYVRGRATKFCDLLQQSPDSPWQGRIRMAGDSAKPEHLIRQHTVVASLEAPLRDAFLSRLTDDEVGRLLVNFWAAVAQRWPMAVKEPRDYYLLKTIGVYAMHMVFPDLVHLCRETNTFTANRMYDLLIETGISVGFWHKSHGHPMVKETGARYMRAAGEYLRERLPQLAMPRI